MGVPFAPKRSNSVEQILIVTELVEPADGTGNLGVGAMAANPFHVHQDPLRVVDHREPDELNELADDGLPLLGRRRRSTPERGDIGRQTSDRLALRLGQPSRLFDKKAIMFLLQALLGGETFLQLSFERPLYQTILRLDEAVFSHAAVDFVTSSLQPLLPGFSELRPLLLQH